MPKSKSIASRPKSASKKHADFMTFAIGTPKQESIADHIFGFNASAPAVDAMARHPKRVRILLESYAQALATSSATRQPVDLVIQVQPSGDHDLVSSTEMPTAESNPLPDALAEARMRGKHMVAQILAGDEMLSVGDFASLLGTTRTTINTKRQKHVLLALHGATRGFRFPSWQIDSDGQPLAALPKLFRRLEDDAWAVYRFLTERHPELDGLTGLSALRRGKDKQALEVAESISHGTFV
jgi:hypothetical protein